MSVEEEVFTVDILANGYQYETSALQLNIVQSCTVISIISPHAFTIQLTRDLVDFGLFRFLCSEYYNSIDDLQIPREYLRQNLLCVTYDEAISAWNRSQIMEYDSNEDTVNVFYVDLNSWEENVSRSRLRFILTKYSSRPVCVLACRLASIAPVNQDHQWNDVVCKTFQDVVLNRQCDVEPLYQRSDAIFYVNLFAPHDEAYVCINDFLIHCKMARPMDDTANEENIIYMLDDHGRPMHSMMTLYWKAGETTHEKEPPATSPEEDHRSTTSNESYQTKQPSFTKVVRINDKDQLIFARYHAYVMLPWFTISPILNELDEEKIKNLANKFGFKPVTIDPLSHPLLCSELLKLVPTTSAPISLYSIDCVRKIFQSFDYQQGVLFDLLDRARLAEASDDMTFWNQAYENLSTTTTNESIPDDEKHLT